MQARLSIPILIVANLVPLAGVLLWDWDVFLLLLLFWCENVIIGIFGIARLIVAGKTESPVEGLILPVFFLVHYGGFMFGHFMVLFAMYSGHVEEAGRLAHPRTTIASSSSSSAGLRWWRCSSRTPGPSWRITWVSRSTSA
jgi:hypothetical protein